MDVSSVEFQLKPVEKLSRSVNGATSDLPKAEAAPRPDHYQALSHPTQETDNGDQYHTTHEGHQDLTQPARGSHTEKAK